MRWGGWVFGLFIQTYGTALESHLNAFKHPKHNWPLGTRRRRYNRAMGHYEDVHSYQRPVCNHSLGGRGAIQASALLKDEVDVELLVDAADDPGKKDDAEKGGDLEKGLGNADKELNKDDLDDGLELEAPSAFGPLFNSQPFQPPLLGFGGVCVGAGFGVCIGAGFGKGCVGAYVLSGAGLTLVCMPGCVGANAMLSSPGPKDERAIAISDAVRSRARPPGIGTEATDVKRKNKAANVGNDKGGTSMIQMNGTGVYKCAKGDQRSCLDVDGG